MEICSRMAVYERQIKCEFSVFRSIYIHARLIYRCNIVLIRLYKCSTFHVFTVCKCDIVWLAIQ